MIIGVIIWIRIRDKDEGEYEDDRSFGKLRSFTIFLTQNY